MHTDISFLHDAISAGERTWSGRRTGKTTILIHALAHQVQLAIEATILVLFPHERDIFLLEKPIKKILDEQGILLVAQRPREWIVRYDGRVKSLRFICSGNVDQRRGYLNSSEVDLSDY